MNQSPRLWWKIHGLFPSRASPHPPTPAGFHRKAISSTTGEYLLQSTDLTNRNHRQGRWLAQPYKGVLQVGLKAHRNIRHTQTMPYCHNLWVATIFGLVLPGVKGGGTVWTDRALFVLFCHTPNRRIGKRSLADDHCRIGNFDVFDQGIAKGMISLSDEFR